MAGSENTVHPSELLGKLHKFGGSKEHSEENNGTDTSEEHSSEVKHEGETRWVPNDSPLQGYIDEGSVDKGSPYDELDISNLLRKHHKFDDKKELSAENNGHDRLEDHSSEVKQEGVKRWFPNDLSVQSKTDGEYVDKRSQYDEHDISNILRNLHKLDDKKELSAEHSGPDSFEDHSSEVEPEEDGSLTTFLSKVTLMEESVDKGSQYEEHDISKLLRSIEERPVNQEIDWADSLRNRRLENYAKAYHVNDDSPGKQADIELLASLAQQANDVGIQRDLDEYERLAEYEREPVSKQGFMDIQTDNQPLDEKFSRY
ncbi:hypothetical protein ACJMK2_003824 [Sinanodonta woodiana]|uniref:Uncharacterized protein n=1 Tax=Sinanodonta woodiana TaxID=1069815 RepID=A0ABD3Y0X9_SINWO